MNWNQVKNLLDGNGLKYKVSRVENSKDYYCQKGFRRSRENRPSKLLSILNPNHDKHIELIFDSDES